VFLDVRDAAATILENTTVSDLVSAQESPRSNASHHYPKQERREV
jgi:DNA-binding IscR family transcriptional regulator